MYPEVPNKLYDVARQARQLQAHLRRSLPGEEKNEVVLKLGLYCLTVLGSLARQAEALADFVLAIQGTARGKDT
jgi:hypothetical protein